MKQSVKEKWTQFLRSGEYEQTQGKLRGEGNKRCCLGVLCDIYKQEHENAEWEYDGSGANFVVYKDEDKEQIKDFSHGGLPRPVYKWAELEDVDGSLVELPGEGTFDLSTVNDGGFSGDLSAQRDFIDIAQLIENQL